MVDGMSGRPGTVPGASSNPCTCRRPSSKSPWATILRPLRLGQDGVGRRRHGGSPITGVSGAKKPTSGTGGKGRHAGSHGNDEKGRGARQDLPSKDAVEAGPPIASPGTCPGRDVLRSRWPRRGGLS